jgi:hypothetical protein
LEYAKIGKFPDHPNKAGKGREEEENMGIWEYGNM